MYLRARTA